MIKLEFTPEGHTRDDTQVSGHSVGLIPFDIVTPLKLYYPHPRTVYYEKSFFILFLWPKLHCVSLSLAGPETDHNVINFR